MFISGGDAFLLKCKTVQKPSCFKTGFWITEYKTGEGDKPSKGGVWWYVHQTKYFSGNYQNKKITFSRSKTFWI